MDHPKSIGDRSTLAVMLGLQAAGYAVLLPFGENTRYDLVIDDGTGLARVQCKAGRFRAGAVWFKTVSSYAHHKAAKQPRRVYHGEIDYFGVHCWETGGVYLVPIGAAPNTSEASLRVVPARNGQKTGVRMADSYEVARIHAWVVRDVDEPRAVSTGATPESASLLRQHLA